MTEPFQKHPSKFSQKLPPSKTDFLHTKFSEISGKLLKKFNPLRPPPPASNNTKTPFNVVRKPKMFIAFRFNKQPLTFDIKPSVSIGTQRSGIPIRVFMSGLFEGCDGLGGGRLQAYFLNLKNFCLQGLFSISRFWRQNKILKNPQKTENVN